MITATDGPTWVRGRAQMAKCQSCCGPIRWRNVCQTSKHLARAEAFATALHVLQVPEMQKLVWETMANLVATLEGSEFMIAQDLEFLATESRHAWSAIDLRPCLAFLDKLVGSPARQANSSKVLELNCCFLRVSYQKGRLK